jgi:hypothetical protein
LTGIITLVWLAPTRAERLRWDQDRISAIGSELVQLRAPMSFPMFVQKSLRFV